MPNAKDGRKKQSKKPKTIREQCVLDIQNMEERLSDNFNSKLDRIERTLAAITPAQDTHPAPAEAQPPLAKRQCQPSAMVSHHSQVSDLEDNAQNFTVSSHQFGNNSGINMLGPGKTGNQPRREF